MDREHGINGPAGCKLCDARRAIDFGQGSREQSFRGLADSDQAGRCQGGAGLIVSTLGTSRPFRPCRRERRLFLGDNLPSFWRRAASERDAHTAPTVSFKLDRPSLLASLP
jgi:hypothetical protein